VGGQTSKVLGVLYKSSGPFQVSVPVAVLSRAARCHPTAPAALGPGPAREAARLKLKPEAGGGLLEAASSASGSDSTVNTENDELTPGMS